MSESVEMTENNEKESQEDVSSSVAAQYELFNKELGLDETSESKKEDAKEASKEDATGEATVKETTETNEKETESSKEPVAEETTEKVEEPEEPDSEDEPIEDDVDDWEGEDPNEAEVEQFCQPTEQVVMADLADQSRKRRVVIYPIKLGELGHPSIVEVIKNSVDFKTTFVQCKVDESSNDFAFHGLIEFNCKSTIGAVEAVEALKTIREDVKVRIMDPGETAKKLMQAWNTDCAAISQTITQNLLVVKPLATEVTLEQLRDLFPDASDIMIAHPKFFPRLAYVSYDDSKAVDEIVSRYSTDRPVIGECRLKVHKYQPPNLPAGFLRMKRRYRILLQVKKLNRALKDKKASYSDNQRKKMKSTIEHCTSLIEKDDAARNELGLKVMTLQELRRIRKIRESVKPETIWLPRQPGDKREDHSRVYLGEDDDKESSHERRGYSSKYSSGKRFDRFSNRSPPRSKWHDSRGGGGGPGGVPSLMSMPMDGPIEPIARVHAITQQLAHMASMLTPPMRGGGGGAGGMNRGRGSFRDSRFSPGRGGFQGGDMDGEFGPPGGFGSRRGGGYGSGGGSYNKRPRQDSGDRNSRDDAPRNRSEDGREPAGKIQRQDTDNTKADPRSSQPPSQQKSSYSSSSRGQQQTTGWSKPPSKFNQGAGSTGSGGSSSGSGFNKSSFNQAGGGGFKKGGFNQGGGTGYGQGGGSGGFNQGSGTGFSQGGVGGGGFNQGGSGGYNQGSGGYNQGSGGSYSQGGGAGGYNQGSGSGFSQGSGTYNQGSGTGGGAGYNQSAATFNQGTGYNQTAGSGGGYQQSTNSSYGNQGTGYDYNYPSQTGTGTGAYQATQTPAQPAAAQQTWGTGGTAAGAAAAGGGQNYWQQPQQQQQASQGTWQPAAQTAGQAQSTDQSNYSYGWNTGAWK